MKRYFTILVALLSYGCVTQQPKQVTPPQDHKIEASSTEVDSAKVHSEKIESKPMSSTSQTKTKVSKMTVPKTSSIATPKKKVKTEPVVKKPPVNVSKPTPTIQKPVKSDTSQLSSSKKPIEPEVMPIAPSESNTDADAPESTPLSTQNVESEISSTIDSEVSQIIVPESNLPEANVPEINSEAETEVEIETALEQQVIEDNIIEDNVIESNILDFDIAKLPLNFGDTWFLDRNKDKISNTTRCLLSSQTKNFNDGYSDAQISLQLTANTLLIKTKSSIDLTYPDIGLFIDQNKPFPLENIYKETSILIKKNIEQITSQLRNGEQLTVKLGFWPTWPKTETRSIDFSISDFNEAYQSFLACEKL